MWHAYTCLWELSPPLTGDTGVITQHQNKLQKSVEKGWSYQIDIKQTIHQTNTVGRMMIQTLKHV